MGSQNGRRMRRDPEVSHFKIHNITYTFFHDKKKPSLYIRGGSQSFYCMALVHNLFLNRDAAETFPWSFR